MNLHFYNSFHHYDLPYIRFLIRIIKRQVYSVQHLFHSITYFLYLGMAIFSKHRRKEKLRPHKVLKRLLHKELVQQRHKEQQGQHKRQGQLRRQQDHY